MSVPNSSTHGNTPFTLSAGAGTGTGAAAATANSWTALAVPLWIATIVFSTIVLGQVVRRWRLQLRPDR